MHKTKIKAFTLIELLITLAIVFVLSGIVFSQMSESRIKARDAKRLSDINQIQLALEAYFEKSPISDKSYPENLNQLVEYKFINSIAEGSNYKRDENGKGYCLGIRLEKAITSLYNECDSGVEDDNYYIKR